MAKKRHKERLRDSLALIELRHALVLHAISLREAIRYLEANNVSAAIARLDGAVSVIETTGRAQLAGVSMKCDECRKSSPAMDWVSGGGLCPVCTNPQEPTGGNVERT